MSIKTWSFARLWAISAAIWLLALSVGELLDYFDLGSLATFAFATIPAFLAGAWAGSHPEIGNWPRVRVAAMWSFALAGFLGVAEHVGHWLTLAAVLAAPVAILTLRWYELTQGVPRLSAPAPSSGSYSVITPPPPPPPPRLPGSSS